MVLRAVASRYFWEFSTLNSLEKENRFLNWLFSQLSFSILLMQMIDKLWGIFCENIVKMLRLVICRQILDNMWAIYWCLPTKCPLLEGDDHLHGDLRKNRFPPKRVDNSQLSLKRGLQSWFFNSQLLNRYNSTEKRKHRKSGNQCG